MVRCPYGQRDDHQMELCTKRAADPQSKHTQWTSRGPGARAQCAIKEIIMLSTIVSRRWTGAHRAARSMRPRRHRHRPRLRCLRRAAAQRDQRSARSRTQRRCGPSRVAGSVLEAPRHVTSRTPPLQLLHLMRWGLAPLAGARVHQPLEVVGMAAVSPGRLTPTSYAAGGVSRQRAPTSHGTKGRRLSGSPKSCHGERGCRFRKDLPTIQRGLVRGDHHEGLYNALEATMTHVLALATRRGTLHEGLPCAAPILPIRSLVRPRWAEDIRHKTTYHHESA